MFLGCSKSPAASLRISLRVSDLHFLVAICSSKRPAYEPQNPHTECIISGREAVISRNNINSAAGKQNSPAKKGLGDLRRLSTVSPAENPEALVHDGASDHCLLDGPARENDVDATIQYCKGFQKNKETGKYEQKEGSGEFEEFGTPNVGTTRMGYANKPKPGDRIKYVFIDNKEGKLLGERIETPQYIIQHGLKLDYHYYITNQLMNPLQQLFSLAVEKIYLYKGKKNKDVAALHELLGKMFEDTQGDLETFMKKREKYCSGEVKKLLFDPFLTDIYNTQHGIQTLYQFYSRKQ